MGMHFYLVHLLAFLLARILLQAVEKWRLSAHSLFISLWQSYNILNFKIRLLIHANA